MTQEKINIAELLKDCPKGMELSSPVYKNLTYDYIDEEQARIYCKVDSRDVVWFSIFGCVNLSPNAKMCIFPKGKTTWEGFVPPCKFKAGDVLYVDCADAESDGDLYKYLFILKEIDSLDHYFSYCHLSIDGFFPSENYLVDNRYTPRLASEEEKEKLFDAIKDNGYRWNPETKTLEKLPKFKVGDKIKHKCEKFRLERTIISCGKSGYWTSTNDWIDFASQDYWELVPNKFDINTLVPYESKVLVRDGENQYWSVSFWGCFFKCEFMYDTVRGRYKQCIPYEGNEHLLGKKYDCDEYYKTWE